jgi:hypothetical protein
LPEARIAVRVPGSAVVISVILFIPLSFVPTAVVAGFTRIGFRGAAVLPFFVTSRPAVLVLPARGRPRSAVINVTTGWRGARAFTTVRRTLLTISITVITVTVITTFIPTIIIGATIVVGDNSDCLATEVLSIQLLCGTISVLARLVLQDTFTDVVAVYVSERNASSLTTEILEILPTGVPRNPRYDEAKPGRSSGPNSTVGVVSVPFWSTLLGKFDNNVGPHETLSVESIQGIFGIAVAFELNKPKASHDTNINNTAVTIEKFGDIVRASVHRQTAKVESAGHG